MTLDEYEKLSRLVRPRSRGAPGMAQESVSSRTYKALSVICVTRALKAVTDSQSVGIPVVSRHPSHTRAYAWGCRETSATYRASNKRLLRRAAFKLACLAFSITLRNISGRLRAQRCCIISLWRFARSSGRIPDTARPRASIGLILIGTPNTGGHPFGIFSSLPQ